MGIETISVSAQNIPAGIHIAPTGIEIELASAQNIPVGIHIAPTGIEIELTSVQNIPAGKYFAPTGSNPLVLMVVTQKVIQILRRERWFLNKHNK